MWRPHWNRTQFIHRTRASEDPDAHTKGAGADLPLYQVLTVLAFEVSKLCGHHFDIPLCHFSSSSKHYLFCDLFLGPVVI